MESNAPSRLPAKARDNLKKVLNHALQEELALSSTMHDFLGKITGPNKHSLYRLFGDQAKQLDQWLGEITNRAKAFGTVARAGASEIARSAQAAVTPGGRPPPRNMIGELLAQHEGIAERLRHDLAAASSDPATAELLKRLVDFHETTAWMLRMVEHGAGGSASTRINSGF
jgi:starvation-inducible DNA-binding protein